MPACHVETAIGQFTGTRTLLATELERALEAEPAMRAEIDTVRTAAYEAVDTHLDWLRSRLDDATGDPRLGEERFTRKLALALDTTTDADALLARAEADLAATEEQLAETASRLRGGARGPDVVRQVLDELAAGAEVTDATIVGLCEEALARTTAFVREHDLVTVYDDSIEIIVMPEIHRGVAVAYCDPPGPLESKPLPTWFAVSPTPDEWPQDRVDSFYREYNGHLLHNLAIHEAMPGHVLQLAHSARYSGATPLRSAFWSGSFVEGWAVYAEHLMAERGYTSRRPSGAAAHATAEDADADDHQHDPRRPGARARHDRGRGDGPHDAARSPGGGRGGRQVAPGAAVERAALDVLRGLHRGVRPRCRAAPAVSVGPGAARRGALSRLAGRSAPALAARAPRR
jgi:uncharacterized protein (DUF885 family)